MKSEKILKVIIILLVVAVAVLGILFYYQNQKFVRISGNNPPTALVPSGAVSTSLTPSNTSNASSARFQFGPLVSPDGQWFLSEEHLEAPENIIDVATHINAISGYALNHRLFLANLYGQARKFVVSQMLEYRDRESNPVPGYPINKSWIPAGWSSDGQTVYFVTSDSPGGNPARTNNGQIINGGDSLVAIKIADGQQQTILKADDVLKESHLIDVYALKNIALITGKKIFLLNLNGSEKKELYTLQSAEQDAVGIFDSIGSRVAIATASDVGDGQDFVHCGQALKVIDITNLSIKVVPTPDSCWSLVGWVDANTLRIQTQDKETDIKIK